MNPISWLSDISPCKPINVNGTYRMEDREVLGNCCCAYLISYASQKGRDNLLGLQPVMRLLCPDCAVTDIIREIAFPRHES